MHVGTHSGPELQEIFGAQDYQDMRAIVADCQGQFDATNAFSHHAAEEMIKSHRPDWFPLDRRIRGGLLDTVRVFLQEALDSLANDIEHFRLEPHHVRRLTGLTTIGRAMEAAKTEPLSVR